MKLLQRGILFGYWICFFLTGSFSAGAQLSACTVLPNETGTGIETVHGPHLAMYNPKHNRHELVLMMVGTGAAATNSRPFDSCIATLGYHVISIDYKNTVITTVCSNSSDGGCFDKFREEIILGKPVSGLVQVDSVNSIVHRFEQLLQYLVVHDPNGGWGEFVEKGRPQWKKIITAGHSQGAGHAAYLGKLFPLKKVLMLSGPQDYLVQFTRPASWQSKPGITAASQYYAFLNRQDPFNVRYQLADNCALMQKSSADSVFITPNTPVQGHPQILVNDLDTQDHHGSTLNTQFLPVWQYMLEN